MSSFRSLAILAVVAVAGAAIWWLLGDDDATPVAPSGVEAPGSTPEAAALRGTGPGGAARAEPRNSSERSDPGSLREAVPGAAERLEVVGRLVDASGRGVPGARVHDRHEDREGVSDESGAFAIPITPQTDDVSLEIRARGYVAQSRHVDLDQLATRDLGSIVLVRGAILAGRVVDQTGRGVAHAQLETKPVVEGEVDFGDLVLAGMTDDDDRPTTDAEGRFELPHVPAGSLKVSASHSEYPTTHTRLEVEAGEERRDLVLTFEAAARITGRITGIPDDLTEPLHIVANAPSRTENPLGVLAALVDTDELLGGLGAGQRTVRVDPDGSFEVRGLAADTEYRIWAVENTSEGLGRRCTERTEAVAGTRGLELEYQVGVSVVFRATDRATGQPVTSCVATTTMEGGGGLMALIGGMGKPHALEADDEGTFWVHNLRPKPEQTLKVTVRSLGYAEVVREGVALPTSGIIDLGTFSLEPRPIVRVYVGTAADGEPIHNAEVMMKRPKPKKEGGGSFTISTSTTIASDDESMADLVISTEGNVAMTGADGWCELTSEPGETVEFAISHPYYAEHVSDPIRLPNANHEERFELVVGAVLSVTVLDTHGNPVANTVVERRGPGDDDEQDMESDEQGRANFRQLTPGLHEIRIQPRFGSGQSSGNMRFSVNEAMTSDVGWESVQLTDTQEATFTLVVPPSGQLTGTVTENGLALSRAQISFLQGPGDTDSFEEEMGSRIVQMFGGVGTGAKTDGDGVFDFDDLPAGEHRLSISHPDRAMSRIVPITLREGNNRESFDLDTSTIRGRVIDPEGNPVSRASLMVSAARPGDEDQPDAGTVMGVLASFGVKQATGIRADSAGEFELRGVRTGVPLRILAQAKGYAQGASEPVEVAEGADRDGVQIVMQRAGRVLVRARNAPFGASVTATPEGSQVPGSVALLQNGRVVLESLLPGRYVIEFTAPDGEEQTQTVDVVAGQSVTVRFDS